MLPSHFKVIQIKSELTGIQIQSNSIPPPPPPLHLHSCKTILSLSIQDSQLPVQLFSRIQNKVLRLSLAQPRLLQHTMNAERGEGRGALSCANHTSIIAAKWSDENRMGDKLPSHHTPKLRHDKRNT